MENRFKFYNTLTRNIDTVIPNEEGKIAMYTCGPTVYHFAHIGNLRSYIMEDVLEKSLRYIGYDVEWNGSSRTVTLNKPIYDNDNVGGTFGSYGSYTARSDSYYDYEDLYWLSRIISAESRGESIEGKLAVGTVVMNRTDHKNYPDTIKGVVFDDKYAVQFTPTANGSIYYDPTDESIFAAKIILEGYRIDEEIIYFVDTKVSPNSWVELNNKFVFKIGCHSFFK